MPRNLTSYSRPAGQADTTPLTTSTRPPDVTSRLSSNAFPPHVMPTNLPAPAEMGDPIATLLLPREDDLRARLVAHLGVTHPSTPVHIIEFCATRMLSKERPYGYRGDQWVPLTLLEGHWGGSEEGYPTQESASDSHAKERLSKRQDHADRCQQDPHDTDDKHDCTPNRIDDLTARRDRLQDPSVTQHPERSGHTSGLTAGTSLDEAETMKREDRGTSLDEKIEELYALARESWRALERVAPGSGGAL